MTTPRPRRTFLRINGHDRTLEERITRLACALGAACIVIAGASSVRAGVPKSSVAARLENFAHASLGALPSRFRSASLGGRTPGTFAITAVKGHNVLSQASPLAGDILYVQTTVPMTSIAQSYSFLYSGPASVVAPFLMSSARGPGGSIQGYYANITASAPDNHSAGKVSYLYSGAASQFYAVVKGRLRTEPYFYRVGHRYRVDTVADPASHVLSTRVYDTALGPQTFDQTIKPIGTTLQMFPGLVNPLGGSIEVDDFSYGPAGGLPPAPHPARRAAEYMNYLGYNAAIAGPTTSVLSQAFQTYFPPLLIKHIRVSADAKFAPSLNAVARFGINATVLTGPKSTVASVRRFVDSLALPPDSLELWNEPNNPLLGDSYDANYAVDLPIFARQLASAFPGVPIWGPSTLIDSTGYPSAIAKLASSVGPSISAWNVHSYTRRHPENVGYGGFFSGACGASHREDCGWYGAPNWNDNNSASIASSLPGVSTEGAASYGTYPDICGAPQVGLDAQQAYVQRGALYNFKIGHLRIYPYKLIDDGGCSDGFGTYGILSRLRNADRSVRAITPKPAYTALVTFDHLLADDGSNANGFTPKPLEYGLSGATPDVEELLLAESDGSYRLVLWSDTQLWDFDAHGPNRVGASVALVRDPVTVQLASPAAVTVYTQVPLAGTWGTSSLGVASTFDATVDQFPIVIAIAPAGVPSNRIALPASVATPGPVETLAPKTGATR